MVMKHSFHPYIAALFVNMVFCSYVSISYIHKIYFSIFGVLLYCYIARWWIWGNGQITASVWPQPSNIQPSISGLMAKMADGL